MYYLHHRVDENLSYVVDTSDWTVNELDDVNISGQGLTVVSVPDADSLDFEDVTLQHFWDTFVDQTGADVNDYFLHTSELYSLTWFLKSSMDTYLRFDAKIDIWATEEWIFCRGYTGTGLCICWATDGNDIKFFSFSGLDINQPFVDTVEDISSVVGKQLWDGEGEAAVFYTPAMSRIAFVRFFDKDGLCEPELIQMPWGQDKFLYER